MSKWEYQTIRLNDYDRKTDDIELLCNAGKEGWELVVILPNNVAYLKRPVDAFAQETIADQREHATTQIRTIVAPSTQSTSSTPSTPSTPPLPVRAQEVKPKYCDPKTNDTWSGRGRMALWLKRKQESGEDIEKYRV